ncbi:exodeoxyribonuclease VII large subunit [Enteractinococcus fodinae]|uniref:Exodeoxyribonuclease 7 large subunit n=1 Tax=Enteractinococcus fodinae TaxID=684663 RepID=A0ABU2AYY0_9MICC|nr:exodeoxyribonuclease VII large subunit [Enteractinococcus fodinae]MDR7346559.1 exodeoxyribonuclease VII large subunit [Enteractinococcus fodinae]
MSEHTSGTAQPQQAADTTPENPWPLSRLSDNLKQYIERVSPTWVEGQLIEHRVSRGHAWMTLRDLDVEMSLPVVAWSRTAQTLDPSIKEGARVVALVKPNFYTKTGRLTMIVNDMRPVGIGELLARVERLRRALAEEGLFAPERKKPLPMLPNRIGLITGRDSDAMHDVQRNVWLRWPAAEFEVFHAAMQGPQVSSEVTAALYALDQNPAVDVIVIARGGGALEEVILPFSDEALIRAVSGVRTPVVSAIGHEADRPVLDDVADFRASTPTDAAKTIVPDAAMERAGISDVRLRMAQAVQRLVDVQAHQIQQLRSRPVLAQPETMITARRDEVRQLLARIRSTFAHQLHRATDHVGQLQARVRSLSPQQTLNRGYAVVQHDDAILRNAGQVTVGDKLDILVAAGRLTATATSVTETTQE